MRGFFLGLSVVTAAIAVHELQFTVTRREGYVYAGLTVFWLAAAYAF